jgi:hypothetical protein
MNFQKQDHRMAKDESYIESLIKAPWWVSAVVLG